MKRVQSMCVLVVMVALSGCSAHSPFIIKGTTDTVPISQEKHAPHSNPIFVTAASLPTTAQYEVVAQIEVGKVWYGSGRNVLQTLAERARQLGADAVVEVKTWHQPAGWSWAAPHGSGKAVKLTENSKINFSTMQGSWYSVTGAVVQVAPVGVPSSPTSPSLSPQTPQSRDDLWRELTRQQEQLNELRKQNRISEAEFQSRSNELWKKLTE